MESAEEACRGEDADYDDDNELGEGAVADDQLNAKVHQEHTQRCRLHLGKLGVHPSLEGRLVAGLSLAHLATL